MKILVVSPTPTFPLTAGNRVRIHATIEALEEAGHEVHLAHIELELGASDAMREAYLERFHRIAYQRPARIGGLGRRCLRWAGKRLGVSSWYSWGIDDWYDDSADLQLRRLDERYRFDAVIVEYVFMSRALRAFPPRAVKMIDAHDVMTDRHLIYLKSGQAPQWFSTTASEEARGLRRADVVLAIQDSERQFLQTLTPARVITFGHITPVDNRFLRTVHGEGCRLLFVGSQNTMNIEGMHYFLETVYPRVRDRVPHVRLLVAGRICERIPDSPDVRKMGHVETITDAYDLADVVINPVRFGTGLNIKTIEALGFGMPLVTTAQGARGLEAGAGEAFLVANDAEAFAERIRELTDDHMLQHRLSGSAVQFARQWNKRQIGMLLAEARARDEASIEVRAQSVARS